MRHYMCDQSSSIGIYREIGATPSSMKFSAIGALQVPKFVLNLDRIPWNLSFQILMKIIVTFAGIFNFRKLISTLYLFVNLFHHLLFYFSIFISYLGMKSWDLHVCDRASMITHVDRVKKVIRDTRYDFAKM